MNRAMPHCGVTISGENIPDSDYADDMAALEGDLADITRTLESIEAASSELGLHISFAKTKVQNIGPPILHQISWSMVKLSRACRASFSLAAPSAVQMVLDPSSFAALG